MTGLDINVISLDIYDKVGKMFLKKYAIHNGLLFQVGYDSGVAW